jgi:aminopeptidase N
VKIFDGVTHVTSTMRVVPRGSAAPPAALFLHAGKDVVVTSATVGGEAVAATAVESGISLPVAASVSAAGAFDVVTQCDIVPEKNTELEGLYKSSEGMYCTQCEAEGFRAITPFIDRPDNMSLFTVRVEAPKATCPVLLSNGDETGRGDLADGRHWSTWVDPFPKPSYLFALVAGDLVAREDAFTTRAGKPVALKLWTKAVDVPKSAWAMESIKKAMKWDEDRFGLEYDLGVFNVVAVSDFNMGAMENKSLNIFNSRLVMATPESATDVDFGRIEGVIGHEYFHNWTGNRVTCRDWFQLTLKEGLTVYRDHEFSSDLNSRPVARIENVSILRRAQFAEDSGPMAHPIRPDEYASINNFYSSTVYEKGSEIIRIYATVLGTAGFRAGMDLYFQRHDGAAVTCDDFYASMRDANAAHPAVGDLPALHVWYAQAGTPRVAVTTAYDAAAQTFTVTATQATPGTPGQPAEAKRPVLIPLSVGLLGADGKDLPLSLAPGTRGVVEGTTAVLRLAEATGSFVFTRVAARPTPSILRGFSAPVVLDVEGQTDDDLAFLLAHDADAFNRFEAGQRYAKGVLVRAYVRAHAALAGAAVLARADFDAVEGAVAAALGADAVPSALVAAFENILDDAALDGAFAARATAVPSDAELVEAIPGGAVDPVLLAAVRAVAVKALARALAASGVLARASARVSAHADFAPGAPFSPAFDAVARRALRNRLSALAVLGAPAADRDAALAAAAARARAATNMTDEIAALACLVDAPPTHAARADALAAFARKWADEPLVLLKWMSLQAMGADATPVVQAVSKDPRFLITNPNSCYS